MVLASRPAMGDCLGDSTIAAYVDGELGRDAIAHVDRHIDGCESCRGQLSAVAVAPVLRSFVATRTLSESRAPTAVAVGSYPGTVVRGADPAPGSALGRYVVDAVIGRGGMGVVVRAYDPELDRQVAIKIVDPAASSGAWRAGLRAEAQAMARLRHPNVVAVHDVGSVGDRVFVAMELVEGASLGTWRAGRGRDAALGACVAAGRGLVAAHAAGVVHGDVKPDNILVDRDGRAMIADFGLARAIASTAGGAAGDRALCGTPAYMAPELFAGAPADVRSDQFAFAVTVYECVAGARPWRGDSLDALRAAITAGPPPRPAGVPPGLWAAIARGLATDPAARHSTLAAFVAELARQLAPARRRRRWIAAGVAAVVVAGGAVAAVAVAGPDDRAACADPIERTAPVARAAAPLCGTVALPGCAALAQALDGKLAAWRASHRAVCRATRDGAQSTALLDARMRCLDRALAAHAALVDQLVPRPLPATAVPDAMVAAKGLADPARCETAEAGRYPAPPADRAAAIADGQRRVDAAFADHAIGRYRSGLAALTAHEAAIRALAYPPLTASLDHILGTLQRDVGDLAAAELAFEHALRTAAEIGDDVTSATVLLELAHLVAEDRQEPDRGAELLRAASAAVVRAGNLAELEARYLMQRAGIAEQRGDLAAAAGDLARAAELRVTTGDRAETAVALMRLGVVEAQLGRSTEGRAHCTEALAAMRDTLGADHPMTAHAESQLGIVHAIEADYVAARRHWVAALASLERSVGADSPETVNTLMNLADVSRILREPEAAKGFFDRAIAIADRAPDDPANLRIRLQVARQRLAAGEGEEALAALTEIAARAEAVLGPKHTDTADAYVALARAYYTVDRMFDARTAFERAVELHRAAIGERHQVTLGVELQYGQTLMELGEPEDARRVFARALHLLDGAVPADSPILAQARSNLADCLLSMGEYPRAVELAELGFATRVARDDDPVQLSESRFILGRALWASKLDRRRGLELVKTARDEMAAIGRDETSLTAAERWLAGKR